MTLPVTLTSAYPKFKLYGRHFIVNIALPENQGGILNLNRDPRKQRLKPDVYVGIVEEVGPDCQYLEVGQKICLERWEYQQQDIDDERIIADEVDVLVLGDTLPAPGCVVIKLIDQTPKTSLVISQALRPPKPTYYCGLVQCSGVPQVERGEIIYIPRKDDFQYRLGADRLVFRVVDDNSILMALTPEYSLEESTNE